MLQSLWTWIAISALIVVWLPFLALVRLFDRDPAHYRTGYYFRRLGWALTRVNPSWEIDVSGYEVPDPRRPYVVVSNHQSLADIPVVSCLPWEMKWIGKTELFRLPFVGWMMRLAGDIELERGDPRSGARALLQAREYLRADCSVIIFPEGTRSKDGRVGSFSDGAFRLAVKEKLPVLPIALDGTRDALPKHSWRFGERSYVHVKVLPPIETESLSPTDVSALMHASRQAIIGQIAQWRGVPVDEIDVEAGHVATS